MATVRVVKSFDGLVQGETFDWALRGRRVKALVAGGFLEVLSGTSTSGPVEAQPDDSGSVAQGVGDSGAPAPEQGENPDAS